MAYLLDTDIYIYLAGGNEKVREKILEVGDENIFLSSISVAELYFGVFSSFRQPENLKAIQRNLEKLQILNFTKHTARVFGQFKAQLKKKGRPMADMDLAIASIALHHQHVLVTHNTRHFSVLDELSLEDWS
jgi:tRNA(fMet)-specific endonuclease VapC